MDAYAGLEAVVVAVGDILILADAGIAWELTEGVFDCGKFENPAVQAASSALPVSHLLLPSPVKNRASTMFACSRRSRNIHEANVG